jgi:hypothetical protein
MLMMASKPGNIPHNLTQYFQLDAAVLGGIILVYGILNITTRSLKLKMFLFLFFAL